jgi:hypothetical protein
MAPYVDKLADETAGKLKVVKLNTQDNPEVPARYGITAIPTFLLIKKGEVVHQIVGSQPYDQFKKARDGEALEALTRTALRTSSSDRRRSRRRCSSASCARAHRPLALVTLPDKPRGRGQRGRGVAAGARGARRDRGAPARQPARRPTFLARCARSRPTCCRRELRRDHEAACCSSSRRTARSTCTARCCRAGAARRRSRPRSRAGDAVTGVSIQRIVLALDEGDVLLASAHDRRARDRG